ncbi:TetR/AcrR family transcriptional regulator [Bacillus horti]|uniref:AcrR family transcriptional regulator n=1 Tax=Caldalkalibacillus horti TaxID=77523 RepID=A0ABT9VVA9_9BACI|nr:TetR family transcriptional regulator [Bacillus horti]MDQ0164920.1 AcrR family transcriptional regulator [Bacillus horti]
MSDDAKKEDKPSFIAEARRNQIIEAAIRTLDEDGYVKASLAQIAKKAGISTALISYHFSDKSDLMNHLLMYLLEDSTAYILGKVHQERTHTEKLKAFIKARLSYQHAQPDRYTALIEIIFNARTPDNIPYYKLNSEEDEDAIMNELQSILLDGQKKGAFGDFHVSVVATMIQGAIGEYVLNSDITKKVDVEIYSNELISIVLRVVEGK